MSAADNDEEDYFLPLEDQRVFGAGIKRKRVPFVRASDDLQTTTRSSAPVSNASPRSVADIYSAIVMPKKHKSDKDLANKPADETIQTKYESSDATVVASTSSKTCIEIQSDTRRPNEETTVTAEDVCELCNLPIKSKSSENANQDSSHDNTMVTKNAPHEASMVHQICLEHSHPPSHLDRTRHGLKYLTSYGWDPDSRIGLGAEGRTGILQPIKPKAKTSTSGLGLTAEDEEAVLSRKNKRKQEQEERQRLNAKQVRLAHLADKKKGDKLRELFYASDDIQRYLGGDI